MGLCVCLVWRMDASLKALDSHLLLASVHISFICSTKSNCGFLEELSGRLSDCQHCFCRRHHNRLLHPPTPPPLHLLLDLRLWNWRLEKQTHMPLPYHLTPFCLSTLPSFFLIHWSFSSFTPRIVDHHSSL